jgi:hypothetical protein
MVVVDMSKRYLTRKVKIDAFDTYVIYETGAH